MADDSEQPQQPGDEEAPPGAPAAAAAEPASDADPAVASNEIEADAAEAEQGSEAAEAVVTTPSAADMPEGGPAQMQPAEPAESAADTGGDDGDADAADSTARQSSAVGDASAADSTARLDSAGDASAIDSMARLDSAQHEQESDTSFEAAGRGVPVLALARKLKVQIPKTPKPDCAYLTFSSWWEERGTKRVCDIAIDLATDRFRITLDKEVHMLSSHLLYNHEKTEFLQTIRQDTKVLECHLHEKLSDNQHASSLELPYLQVRECAPERRRRPSLSRLSRARSAVPDRGASRLAARAGVGPARRRAAQCLWPSDHAHGLRLHDGPVAHLPLVIPEGAQGQHRAHAAQVRACAYEERARQQAGNAKGGRTRAPQNVCCAPACAHLLSPRPHSCGGAPRAQVKREWEQGSLLPSHFSGRAPFLPATTDLGARGQPHRVLGGDNLRKLIFQCNILRERLSHYRPGLAGEFATLMQSVLGNTDLLQL